MSLVYYHIEKDLIFEDWQLDGFFYGLVPGVYWDKIILLGEL